MNSIYPPKGTVPALVTLLALGWPLTGSATGRMLFQNRDEIPAELVELSHEATVVRSPVSDSPFFLLDGWPLIWDAGQGSKRPALETRDLLFLKSGQPLQGRVRRFDDTTLLFVTGWGDEIIIPRAEIASFLPGRSSSDTGVELKEWTISHRRHPQLDVKKDWRQTGGFLTHPEPHQHQLSRRSQETFSDFVLDLKLSFQPEGTQYHAVVRANQGQAHGHTIRVYYLQGKLVIRDNRFLNEVVQVKLPPSALKTVTHHVQVHYDLGEQKIHVYLNGNLMKSIGIFTDDPEKAVLNRPEMSLFLGRGLGVTLHRFRLITPDPSKEMPTAWSSADPGVQLANGDVLASRPVSYSGGAFSVQMNDLSLELPVERVNAVYLSPFSEPEPKPIRVFLNLPHPVLSAKAVTMKRGEPVKVFLPGLEAPLSLKREDIARIQWPRNQDIVQTEDILHRLVRDDSLQVTGKVRDLLETEWRIQPVWTTETFRLHSKEGTYLESADRNRKNSVLGVVMLANGDVLSGEVASLRENEVQIRHPSYEETLLRSGHVQTLLKRKLNEGSWVLNPYQMFPHTILARTQQTGRPGAPIKPNRKIIFPGNVKHSLPSNAPAYFISMTWEQSSRLNFGISLDGGLHEKKRIGTSVTLSGNSVYVLTRESGHLTRKLPGKREGVLHLEIQLFKPEKRLKISFNGEVVFDEKDLSLEFSPELADIRFFGLSPDCRIHDVQILPAPLENAEGQIVWIPGKGLSTGRLMAAKGETPAFQHRDTGEKTSLSMQEQYVLHESRPSSPSLSISEAQEEQQVVLRLRDRMTVLTGHGVTIADGILTLKHRSFPNGFRVAVDEVQRLYW